METSKSIRSVLYALFAVCPILFFTDLTRNPFYTQIAILNVLICVVWLLWIVQAFRARQWIWISTDLDWPLAMMFAVCVASWLVSFILHPRLAMSIYSEGSRGVIFLIVNTLLVFGAAARSQDRGLVKRLLWITYAVSTIAAIYGICQYFGVEFIWPRALNPYGNRPVSTFGNPNFMSSFLVLVMPVMVADFAYRTTGTPRFFLGVSFLSCLAALLATLTRSSWLGLAVGIGLLGLHPSWRSGISASVRKALLILAVLSIAAVVMWPNGADGKLGSAVTSRLGEIQRVEKGVYAPVSQRVLIWTSAWTMFQQHPVLGKGWGCFELFYPFFQGVYLLDARYQGLRTHANNAHNEILEYLSQTGLLGLGVMIWFWIVFFRLSWSINMRVEKEWRLVHAAFAAGVAGMLADNLLNVSVHFAVPAFLFWWWVGTSLALDPGDARRPKVISLRPHIQKSVAAIAALVLVCFSGRACAMWMGEVHFFNGFKLSKGGTDLIGAERELYRARQWHRLEVNNDYELANVYARTGQPDKAIPAYNVALEANAGYDEIYFNRATLEMQLGRVDDAIADYQLAIAINPLSHDAYGALASLYLKDLAHYGDKAVALYGRGVSVFPDDKDMWNNLGYIYTQRKEWDKSYDAYRRALTGDPEFDVAWRNLKTIAVHLPNRQTDPVLNQGETFHRAESQLASKDWSGVLQTLEPIKSELPRSFRVHFYSANALFGLGRYEEAATEYQLALQRRSDSAPVWQNFGATLERLNLRDQAKQAFQRALQLDPNNVALRQHLEQIH